MQTFHQFVHQAYQLLQFVRTISSAQTGDFYAPLSRKREKRLPFPRVKNPRTHFWRVREYRVHFPFPWFASLAEPRGSRKRVARGQGTRAEVTPAPRRSRCGRRCAPLLRIVSYSASTVSSLCPATDCSFLRVRNISVKGQKHPRE